MLMLKILLKLFPRRFQERFGEEWMETAEALVGRAQAQGSGKTVAAWLSLCTDVGTQAPVAHAKEAWRAIVGTPPVLAGAGVMGGTWMLARHWGGRPAMAMGRGLIKYAWALATGGAFAFLLHGWLEQRAWAVSTTLTDVGVSGSGMTDNPQALTLVVGVLLAALMLVAGWPKLFAKAKAITVRQVLGGLVSFLLGFYLVLTSIFLGEFRELSTNMVSDFFVYPEISSTPARAPDSINPEEWTDGQREWFDSNRPWATHLRPEKKAEWCALKEAQLNTWHKTIMSRDTGSTVIPLLLWQAVRTNQYAHGCMDESTWLGGHNEVALSAQEATGLFHRTWEPLAAMHPLVDQILMAHHLVWPRLVMTPQKYCTTTAQVMVEPGHVVNQVESYAVCQALDSQLAAGAESSKPKPWWRPWTTHLKRNNQDVKSVTEAQRQEIRQVLEATRGRWQTLERGMQTQKHAIN